MALQEHVNTAGRAALSVCGKYFSDSPKIFLDLSDIGARIPLGEAMIPETTLWRETLAAAVHVPRALPHLTAGGRVLLEADIMPGYAMWRFGPKNAHGLGLPCKGKGTLGCFGRRDGPDKLCISCRATLSALLQKTARK